MKLVLSSIAGLALLATAGCATWDSMSNSEKGTAIGAGIGGLAGAAVSGGVLAPAGAAIAGGLLGYELGEDQDGAPGKKNEQTSYNRR